MKQHHFEQKYQQQWQELESCLNTKKPTANQLAQFPQRYRQVCQHLSLARARCYPPRLLQRLNQLVLRGHQDLYQTPNDLWQHLRNFLWWQFPEQVRKEYKLVLLSAFLFFGSLLAMFVAVQINNDLIYSLMPAAAVQGMESSYDPKADTIAEGRGQGGDFMMFGHYIQNNIGIGFQTYASGLLFGLGSVFFLVFNGLAIGAVAGHLTQLGYTSTFYSFVVGHSALELTGIVIAGAAGLRLGLALIAPKRQSRLNALKHAAKESLILVYGVILLLLLAAIVEGFWSANALVAVEIKYAVGAILALVLYSYLLFMRRPETDVT